MLTSAKAIFGLGIAILTASTPPSRGDITSVGDPILVTITTQPFLPSQVFIVRSYKMDHVLLEQTHNHNDQLVLRPNPNVPGRWLIKSHNKQKRPAEMHTDSLDLLSLKPHDLNVIATVDWDKGVLIATANKSLSERKKTNNTRFEERKSLEKSLKNLILLALPHVSVDGTQTVSDWVEDKKWVPRQHEIDELTEFSPLLEDLNGMYSRQASLKLLGEKSIAALLSKASKRSSPTKRFFPLPPIKEQSRITKRLPQTARHIVIDAREVSFRPCLFPKILFPNGSVYWDNNTDFSQLRYHSNPQYPADLWGDNPPIVIVYAKSENHGQGSVIASQNDLLETLETNAFYNLYAKGHLSLIMDPPPWPIKKPN